LLVVPTYGRTRRDTTDAPGISKIFVRGVQVIPLTLVTITPVEVSSDPTAIHKEPFQDIPRPSPPVKGLELVSQVVPL
jgi:hypothetical protein